MGTENEIQRRIKARVAEIVLQHGRHNTEAAREEIIEACSEILSEYETEEVEVVLDPIQKPNGSVTVWIGGLPGLEIVPDPDGEEA